MIFEDRVSSFPNRYLVTPENGDTPYYVVLSRADEPTVVGTPLNAGNLNSIYNDCVDYADSLVETKTITVDDVTWTYEKWSDGLVRMWCMVTATYTDIYILEKQGISFPFELIEDAIGFVTINEFTGGGSMNPKIPRILCKTNRCSVQVQNHLGEFTSDSTVNVAVFVIGKWK